MPPRKTANQKHGDLMDTHRILKAYYEVNGQPAGCDTSKLPMTAVPAWHRRQADLLLKELKKRQVVQTRLSEESLTQWKSLLKHYQREHLCWFRDNLPRLLQGLPHTQGKTKTKMERILSSVEVVMQNGDIILNDRQHHHLVEGKEPDTVQCFLTGEIWRLSALQ